MVTFANMAGIVPPNDEKASGSTNALYILTEAYGLNYMKFKFSKVHHFKLLAFKLTVQEPTKMAKIKNN